MSFLRGTLPAVYRIIIQCSVFSLLRNVEYLQHEYSRLPYPRKLFCEQIQVLSSCMVKKEQWVFIKYIFIKFILRMWKYMLRKLSIYSPNIDSSLWNSSITTLPATWIYQQSWPDNTSADINLYMMLQFIFMESGSDPPSSRLSESGSGSRRRFFYDKKQRSSF